MRTMRRAARAGARGTTAVAGVVVAALTLVAATPAAAAPVALTTLGVASVLTMGGGPPQQYQREADAIRAVGASWIRVVVQWHKIEPSYGDVDWSTADNAIDAARAAGLNVLVCLGGPAPVWAQSPGADPSLNGNPPDSAAEFGRFSGAVAARYRDAVSHWEIWNEPNVPEYFTPVDPRRYAAMLQAASSSIRAVQPQAEVLSGGLSSAPYGVDSSDFVRQLFESGAGDAFDAVALHPYTYPYFFGRDPLERDEAVAQVRAVLEQRGQGAKKVWITEYGQATGTSNEAVSPERQRDIVIDFVRTVSAMPSLGPTFLFTSHDLSSDPSNQHFNYGLYSYDYRPKPVADALAQLYGTSP